jgi:tripartite-type tricarboxylate transporter receptor subunit TctC
MLLATLSTTVMAPLRAAWPERPVQLIVPFPAGGPTDALGRLLGRALGDALDVAVLIQNVPGATGQRGATQVARAPPDGLNLLLGTSATHAIAPGLLPNLPYQPTRDFVSIGQVATSSILLVAHPSFPARTLGQMITVARTSPVPLAYGSWGLGSGGHLVAETIRQHAGLRLSHIPYQGIAPMLNDLMGGQIPLAMSDGTGAMALLRADKVVPLAVTGQTRHPAWPDLPTLQESGIPFMAETWFAVFAPAQTPMAVRERLEAGLHAALAAPGVTAAMRSMALEPATLGRQVFDKVWYEDIAVWRKVIADTGVTIN